MTVSLDQRSAALGLLLLLGCRRADEAELLLPKLPDEPRAVLEKVDWGDRHFSRAMEHLRKSDPTMNPDGWPAENRAALEAFTRALQEGYLPAQELYGPRDKLPQPLLDRVRECVMRQSLCRKRSVSAR